MKISYILEVTVTVNEPTKAETTCLTPEKKEIEQLIEQLEAIDQVFRVEIIDCDREQF